MSIVKHLRLLIVMLVVACTPSWSDGPYEVYVIDGVKSLGLNVGDGAYIGRIDEPKTIKANGKFISVYACPEDSCAYYYIDRMKDHKFADSVEFVYGPYTQEKFSKLQRELSLPELSWE